MRPTIGRTVIYRHAPDKPPTVAIVVATEEEIDPEWVESGHQEPINAGDNVHLIWFRPMQEPNPTLPQLPLAELKFNASYAEDTGDGLPAGTWTWPTRVPEHAL